MALAKNSMEGKAQDFLKRIEALIAEGESDKGSYMAECKERREDIKSVYTEAKDAGIAVKALKGVVKKCSLDKRSAAISDGFDIDEQAAYATLVEALGDLGKAAADAAGVTVPPAPNGRADEAHLSLVGQG